MFIGFFRLFSTKHHECIYQSNNQLSTFTACDCHENGTFVLSSAPRDSPLACDQNGQCICRTNVVGLKCDKCVENHWNINSGDGCEACACHSTGAYNDSCDMHSGQCVCKPGVGGRVCDECLPDHYQFSPEGCRGRISIGNYTVPEVFH